MTEYQSKVNTTSENYKINRKGMLERVEKLQKLNDRGRERSEKRLKRFRERGQLTPRERLSRLIDPNMPFFTIANLSGYLQDNPDPDKSLPGGNAIVGIGFIKGVRCVIAVNDSGIQAGSLTESTAYRILRGQSIALKQKLPFIHLVESAGAKCSGNSAPGSAQGTLSPTL